MSKISSAKKNRVIGLLLVWLCLALAVQAQQRPLVTEDVDTLPAGTLRVEVGMDFVQNAKFPVSGLTGDLSRVGVVGINIGVSPNVEIQLDGVLQNFLSINSARPNPPIALNFDPTKTNSTSGIGDTTLSTKIKLRAETKRGPSLGFRFGVELPNSNQARGIGLNQTNAYGTVLIGKKFGPDGRFNTFGNLGLGILSAPLKTFTQNDVVLYGVAGIFRVNKQFNLAGEINGRASTRSGAAPLGTESLSEARFGMQFKATGLRFDVAGIAGLTSNSPRSGVTFGVTYDTPSIFTPVK